VRLLVVSNEVRRHRLISISYISLLPCHGRGRGFESRRPRHIAKPWARVCNSYGTQVRTQTARGALFLQAFPTAPANVARPGSICRTIWLCALRVISSTAPV
jgi:hypothetical protein